MAEWVATSGLESSWNQPALTCKACDMRTLAAQMSTLVLEKTARTQAHRAADCTAPRDTTCRYCKAEGHMIRDCPQKPPMVCGNCGQE
ncbi:hypothetical protein E4U40_007170, partial [Claviceps sp. LM458 group G5]